MLETRLQRWENKAEWALAACAVIFLVLYTYEVLGEPTGRTMTVVSWLLTLLYVPFVIDYVIRIYLADNRLRWFIRHPLDLAADYPQVKRWFDAISARPAVRRGMAIPA